MGLRYYSWPLRDDDEYDLALRDPGECIALLDPGLNRNPDCRIRPVASEDCGYLDKAWGPLQDFLRGGDARDHERFRTAIGDPGYAPERPALLVLEGGAGYRDMRWDEDNPFVCAVTPDEVRAAARDLARVDPSDLARFVDEDPDRSGYVDTYFEKLLRTTTNWADKGWGCLYSIGAGGMPPWAQTVRWTDPYTGRTAAEVHAEYDFPY